MPEQLLDVNISSLSRKDIAAFKTRTTSSRLGTTGKRFGRRGVIRPNVTCLPHILSKTVRMTDNCTLTHDELAPPSTSSSK